MADNVILVDHSCDAKMFPRLIGILLLDGVLFRNKMANGSKR